MNRLDKTISVLALGLLAPVSLMLLFWWGSIPFADERTISLLIPAGFASGVILDLTVLRKFIFRLFELPVSAIIGVGVFYSIMVYGFFMGFPVMNCLVGIAGGYIAARRGIVRKASRDEAIRDASRVNLASLLILSLLCVCTAALALRESTICSQVQGMLGLPFTVTWGMIWALILIGGGTLLFVQFAVSRFLSRRLIRRAYPS